MPPASAQHAFTSVPAAYVAANMLAEHVSPPFTEAVKVTLKVQWALPASGLTQSSVSLKGPVIPIPVMVMFEVPVLVSVTVLAGLVLCSWRASKLRLVGLTDAGETAVPLTGSV